ncbi:hypothetical protein [Rathayibacter iranicus]|uniref:Uncharacterized protein n=2 Tax=Rathayibacter iranicus TaxID=59737 RepID=A0AAD1EMC0_9MICO|nr:hypothetical protein [Rathayibacter iranicus]AZZ55936.1 hypothetical protein C7V51_08660 [Rathayibacter iranicus]MWV30616.1 hypothetical protein [Rathayibacter iranicus NCPPB 2253 = VKM Ac-1602]PPI47090.1 hypothetical protein C5E09_07695 [Rathayibacter iranicus]PPI60090.1 hypothetical protein C5E08_08625 [Rathayibacter iranicus]PPI71654.1 hypothetical protein C5E01_07660 [Rathayibacter iranicus]
MSRDRLGIGVVWALALVGSVVTLAVAAPASRQLWLALTFGGCVLATFAVQLAVARADGYLVRAMTSIVGAMVLVAIASGIALLLPA